jgi:hypothetical protein
MRHFSLVMGVLRLPRGYARRMSNTTPPVVLVGVGEMGGVFAKALLGAGHTVVPVTRLTPLSTVAEQTPHPSLVLVTVGEADLGSVLEAMPDTWRNRVGLIQNELLPRDWLSHGIVDPTVAVVWFEKKPGMDTKVIIASPIAGPSAKLLSSALDNAGIASTVVTTDAIVDELVTKNLYILVANIAGLETGGTVSELWDQHEALARQVGTEVLQVQEYLVGKSIDSDAAYAGMLAAYAGDPDHGTTGRSAPMRLARALAHAGEAGIKAEKLDEIARAHGVVA